MRDDHYCGLSFYHPKWLQKFANTKMFMAVYGLLGTVQAMSFMYFLTTLTTIEKRFKLQSQTTDLLLITINSTTTTHKTQPKNICNGDDIKNDDECKEIVSIVPLILIFLSQFVLGIGNTLYYSLGQTYLDDNTKKKNTPLMLAFAMSLRMIGPVFGFILGAACLNTFIDFTRTPLIDKNDPKWLGAWWFGWIILGSIMFLFSVLIGLFPKRLQIKKKDIQTNNNSNIQKVLLDEVFQSNNNITNKNTFSSTIEIPTLSNFSTALLRLLRNNLLMFNIISAVFYILGASGNMTFVTKYIEVQFQKNAQNATLLVGPLSIMGMVFGLLMSGFIISKKKPNPSKILFWNVIVGFIFVIGQIAYLFLYCSEPDNIMQSQSLNLTAPCNINCNCSNVAYNPVCDSATQKTYFSPCHAGCQYWDSYNKTYMDCSCLNYEKMQFNLTSLDDYNWTTSVIELNNNNFIEPTATEQSPLILTNNEYVTPGVCLKSCATFYIFAIVSIIVQLFGSSGRIGNILVNYRSVSTQDKSIAQGLALMLISLFALIPGPIIFGRLIDSTCLVWTKKCGVTGNCQLYDQTQFRYKINAMAIVLTILGIFFDTLVWYYGRKLDFYGEREEEQLAVKNRNTRLPLLEKQTNS